MKKTKVLTVMVCATMLTASGSAIAAYAEEASAPAFGFNQGGAPGEQMDFMGGQMPSGMPGGQMNMDGQTPPSMPDFSGNQNTENTQDFQGMPDFSGGQFFDSSQQSPPSVPDISADQVSSASQTSPSAPDFSGSQSQNTADSQAPTLPNNFSGENSAQMPPTFNNDQGGFMGGQNPPMGRPAEDDSRVIAKVTGIDGNTLTVETLTFGEDGAQSTTTSTYDISGIEMGEDIKTDSMIQINLNEDGSVSTVSTDQGMKKGMSGGPQNGFPGQQPAADSNHVVAKVTGIDGNTLTVEKLTPGEAGQQSSETVTYDISGITVGEDIKTDSMIEITLGEDGNVSSVSAGRNMPAEGPGMRMQIPGNGPASQIIEYFN